MEASRAHATSAENRGTGLGIAEVAAVAAAAAPPSKAHATSAANQGTGLGTVQMAVSTAAAVPSAEAAEAEAAIALTRAAALARAARVARVARAERASSRPWGMPLLPTTAASSSTRSALGGEGQHQPKVNLSAHKRAAASVSALRVSGLGLDTA
jgi:hypothetical protein